jgi:hypothetical protein
VSDVAYNALVALGPPLREAESKGNSREGDRIASAVQGLLELFDDQTSKAALRKLVALSYFDFGTASSEIYECVVVRKGRAIVPIIKDAIRRDFNPCFAEFGQESPLCSPETKDSKRLNILLRQIEKDEPCTIVR